MASRTLPVTSPSSVLPDLGGDEEWREKIARWTQMAGQIRSRVAQLATAQAHTKHSHSTANYSTQAHSQAAPVMLTHAQLALHAQTLKAQIQQIDREIEAARAEALDDPALLESEQERRMHTIEQHATAMIDLHGHLRTSMLQARAAVERAAVQARNELLGTHDPATAKRRQKQLSGESASDKNAAFSASLLRTRAMLSNEISRSSSALSTLQASTRVLGSTSSEYTTYGGTVAVGRKMITKQLQRERTDRLLLWVGLAFFSLVVIYIVHRRLAPFLFWWTTFFVQKQAQQQQPQQPPVVTNAPTIVAAPASTQHYYYNPSTGAPVYVDPAAASAPTPPLQVHPAYSDQRAATAALIPAAAAAAPAASAPMPHPHAPSMPAPASMAHVAAAAAAAAPSPHAPPHSSTGHSAPVPAHAAHPQHVMPDPMMYAPMQPPPQQAHYPGQPHAGPYGP